MTSTNDNDKRGCKPQWVHHNKLLSYCMKGVHAAPEEVPTDQGAATQGEPLCDNRRCLFALRNP